MLEWASACECALITASVPVYLRVGVSVCLCDFLPRFPLSSTHTHTHTLSLSLSLSIRLSTNLNGLALRREHVGDLDKTRALGEMADTTACVLPPGKAKVCCPRC